MFENIRLKFFSRIFSLLNGKGATDDTIKESKSETNKLMSDDGLEAQKRWVNRVLLKREQEFEKQRPAKEVSKEKLEFRLRIHQAVRKRKDNADMTLDREK